jgi:dimethylglycine dehydrogenase
MDTELITPSEAKAMFPLMDETKFVGAMWDPVEGHLDPSGTTHAYAKARARSAPRSCSATASPN